MGPLEMIGASGPLPGSGIPSKIAYHLFGGSPAQFEPPQTRVGERGAPEV